MLEDIAGAIDLDEDNYPLPEPAERPTRRLQSLLMWALYFLIVWQYCYLVSDNALLILLRFLRTYLTCIASVLPSAAGGDVVMSLAALVPLTMYSVRNVLGIDRDNFERYVVCPKCTKLYRPEDCLRRVGNQVQPVVCDNIQFPRSKRRKPCGSKLVKKVILKNGTPKYYPLKVYCYKSVIDTLETFLKRPNFEKACEHWRHRETNDQLYGDVYDGKVWNSFLRRNDLDFLASPRRFGLMLNVDWFQPFKHRKDISVGVLYMVVMNLPRSERFKRENVIIVGIIPALTKEPPSLNYFLNPLVTELNALWRGMKIRTFGSPTEGAEVRAALICCAADIPAARKLCGFVGHSANHGCSHCNKFFPGGFGEKKDYSGFDRRSWPLRTDDSHRQNARKLQNCRTKTQRKKMESMLGSRYTSLLELPYYGSVTMCVIDPMHNLFLGTAKKMFKIWCENDILTKEKLQQVQERIGNVEAPSDLGRLPGNISSNYGGFTASQWKNWVLYYSLFALEGILGEEHINCWQNFVLACRHLCKACITKTDLVIADRKLLDFCKKVESLYGKTVITPNMHLHLHIRECVENYGSVYGFWLFSFERYNGLLGSFHTNNREIEVQLMRRFLTMSALDDLQYQMPLDFQELFYSLCSEVRQTNLVDVETTKSLSWSKATGGSLVPNSNVWTDLSMIELPSRYRLCCFDSGELLQLRRTYCKLYPLLDLHSAYLNSTYKKYSSLWVGDERLSSGMESRLYKHARVMASWVGDEGEISTGNSKPGRVKFYFEHSFDVGKKQYRHCFACVQWFKEFQDNTPFRNPLSVFYAKVFKLPGAATFIPVQRIQSRFIAINKKHQNFDLLIVCPLLPKTFI